MAAYAVKVGPQMIMIAPFPPPYGGAGKNSDLIYRDLSPHCRVARLSTSVGKLSHDRTIGYHLKRVVQFARNIHQMATVLRRGCSVYIVPDGGIGLIYSLCYLLVARAYGSKTFLHYRNYSYIDKKSLVMVVCQKVVAGDATHIFLDEMMRDRFADAYGTKARTLLCSNAAFVEFSGLQEPASKNLTVGFISNLCHEKGFYDFISVVQEAEKQGLPINFKLAGSPVSSQEERALTGLLDRSPSITYLGPLFGEEKERFYSNCDVVLFPTRFAQEAQPNVVWEAIAAGAVVIAFDRGSIPWMLDGIGTVLSREANFAVEAARIFSTHLANPIGLRDAKAASRKRFQQREQMAKEQYRTLLSELL